MRKTWFLPGEGSTSSQWEGQTAKKKKKKKRVTRVVGGGERVEESFAGAAIVKRGLEDASLRSHG